jgi:hypothetical protein
MTARTVQRAAARVRSGAPPSVGLTHGITRTALAGRFAFEPNEGQFADAVRFVGRTANGAVLLTGRGFAARAGGRLIETHLIGAAAAPIRAEGMLPGRTNYFLGNDRSRWRATVPTYAVVRYAAIYPGIDLVCRGDGDRFEYDFVVAGGADPRQIALRFTGVDRLAIDSRGDLVVHAGAYESRHRRPRIYQEIDGSTRPVAGRFRLTAAREVRFELGEYDGAHTLTIDPELAFSTYLGGRDEDGASALAVDGAGNIYVAGNTSSADFPTAQPMQPAIGTDKGVNVAFVTKFTPDGSQLVFSSYLGGSRGSSAVGIAVDAAGNVYVGGSTTSTNFPTVNALQPALTPGICGGSGTYDPQRPCGDAFIAKLDPSGSKLQYATYLGGSDDDWLVGLALDSNGNVYVAGNTRSKDLPTTDTALQRRIAPGVCGSSPPVTCENGFVAKIDPSGSRLVYATYFGGTKWQSINGIAIDSSGNAFIAGNTESPDLPLAHPLQPAVSGVNDGFVAKLNENASALVYSTYLGGSGSDGISGIMVDAGGSAYVTGWTSSIDFPVVRAFQAQHADPGDCDDAFLAKLDPSGSSLAYSTYLGGKPDSKTLGLCQSGSAVAVDGMGRAVVVGSTTSPNFPVVDATQPDFASKKCIGYYGDYCADGFVAQFTPDGTSLAFATFLGGTQDDWASAVAVDKTGAIYVAGLTFSNDFPTRGAFQSTIGSSKDTADAFIVKIATAASTSSAKVGRAHR